MPHPRPVNLACVGTKQTWKTTPLDVRVWHVVRDVIDSDRCRDLDKL